MTRVCSRSAALVLATAVSVGASFGTSKIARAEHAEEATPDKALNDAKEAFETAQTFFVRGEYDTAAAKFLEAYDKKPFPAFLFNVAVSYEKAKQLEKAKEYFERYLKDDPNASDAAQVRLRLDVIGKLLAPPPPPAVRRRRRRRSRNAARAWRGAGTAPVAHAGCAGTPAPGPRASAAGTPARRDARGTCRAAAAACARPAGAARHRHQGAGRHRLEAAGGDDLSQRQALGPVRQDPLARVAGVEAGPPDPRVEGVEGGGARDQPALRQADRRLHRAVRGALPRLDRDHLQRRRAPTSSSIARTSAPSAARPFTGQLKPGKHTIFLERFGYQPLQQEIDVPRRDGDAAQPRPCSRARPGWVTITGKTTAGGRLIVDEKFGCATPCRTEVPPGKHKLLVEKKGFEDYETDVELGRGIETIDRGSDVGAPVADARDLDAASSRW